MEIYLRKVQTRYCLNTYESCQCAWFNATPGGRLKHVYRTELMNFLIIHDQM
jgi:hypothetical protein